MAGTVKKLQFSEGTDVGAPTDLSLATSTSVIESYADDAAYVTGEGAPINGSMYLNTTLKRVRYYSNSAWRTIVPTNDDADATKQFDVDLDGATTGTTATLDFNQTANRTFTFPDVDLTVAGRANSETLSNKTLASPLISGGSLDVSAAGNFAVGASVGANNMDLGGASTLVRVLGNLEVMGTTTTINTATLDVEDVNITVNAGGTDMSSEGAGITVDRTGTSGSMIYMDASETKWAAGALGSEDPLVTKTVTQTLQNKTLDSTSKLAGAVVDTYVDFDEEAAPGTPSSGKVRVYAKSDKKLYKKDSNGTESEVGSGGAGGIEYITNGDFETGATTSWSAYDDGASATPTDGTGGSPNVDFTIAASTSNPRRGTYSGRITKTANNRQGHGYSFPFTIAAADTSRALKITLEGSASANFVSGDMVLYVYDVTNGVLLNPNVTNVPAGNAKLEAYFVATTSMSYRLILHVATTSALAYTYDFEASVSPEKVLLGMQGGSVGQLTMSFNSSGWGTMSSQAIRGFRSANWLFIQGTFTGGTVGASGAWFDLPSGYSIDYSVLSSVSNLGLVGQGVVHSSATNNIAVNGQALWFFADGSTARRIYCSSKTSSNAHFQDNVNGFANNNPVVTFSAWIPISEWSGGASAVQMMERENEEYAYNTSTNATTTDTSSFGYGPSGNQIGAITATISRRVRFRNKILPTDRITLELMDPRIGVWTEMGPSWSSQNFDANVQAWCVQNGTQYGMGRIAPFSSTDVDVYFGQYPLATGAYGAAASAWGSAAGSMGSCYWRLRKTSGGGLAALDQSCKFKAYRTSAQSVSASSEEIVEFNVEDFDSHGCYDTTTFRFTPNQPGKYLVGGIVQMSNGDDQQQYYGCIYKNGATRVAKTDSNFAKNAGNEGLQVVTMVDMNGSTDYLTFHVYNGNGGPRNTGDAVDTCQFWGCKIL